MVADVIFNNQQEFSQEESCLIIDKLIVNEDVKNILLSHLKQKVEVGLTT